MKRLAVVLSAKVRDKCGWLFAYVYLDNEDRTFVNAKLVQDGYAVVMTMPPNVKHSPLFLRLKRVARENAKGLWNTRSLTSFIDFAHQTLIFLSGTPLKETRFDPQGVEK